MGKKQENRSNTHSTNPTNSKKLGDEEYAKGLVLWIILNEVLFDIEKQRAMDEGRVRFGNRPGAEADTLKIKEALEPFQVDLRIWTDKTLAEIDDSLNEIKKEADDNPNKFAGLVFLGMSHGFKPREKDFLITSDIKMLDLSKVTDTFHNFNCIGFKNKPKCFLYNICRGEDANTKRTEHNHSSTEMDRVLEALVMESDSSGALNTVQLPETVPKSNVISFKKGDYHVVHSTVSGFVSYRHPSLGSPFVQELAAAIKTTMAQGNGDYQEMIRIVQTSTAKHQNSEKDDLQLPEIVSGTLRAKFKLSLKSK